MKVVGDLMDDPKCNLSLQPESVMALDTFCKGLICISESFNRINYNEINCLKRDTFYLIKHHFKNKKRCDSFLNIQIFPSIYARQSSKLL